LSAACGHADKLVPTAAHCHQLAPGSLQLGSTVKLLLPGECVEDVQLVRRAGEAPLLELTRHGEEPLDQRGQILARHGASPRVRARSPVREHPAGGDQALLPGRAQIGDRLELQVVEDPLRKIELGLDVGLVRARAEVPRIARRSEQEPDRLCQDRLAGAGLARDGVQARSEGELGLANEDEALDAQPSEQTQLPRGRPRGNA
jgi:hypothetical protein